MPIDGLDRSRFTMVFSTTVVGSATHVRHGINDYPSDNHIQVFASGSFQLSVEGTFDVNRQTDAASHFVSVSSPITANGFYTTEGLVCPAQRFTVDSIYSGFVSIWAGR